LRRLHWPGSPSPNRGSGYSGELSLNLTIHGALKADEQLLVQHSGDPLRGRQLRDMRAFSSRDTALCEVPAAWATCS
jgi:hypothetical protein